MTFIVCIILCLLAFVRFLAQLMKGIFDFGLATLVLILVVAIGIDIYLNF